MHDDLAACCDPADSPPAKKHCGHRTESVGNHDLECGSTGTRHDANGFDFTSRTHAHSGFDLVEGLTPRVGAKRRELLSIDLVNRAIHSGHELSQCHAKTVPEAQRCFRPVPARDDRCDIIVIAMTNPKWFHHRGRLRVIALVAAAFVAGGCGGDSKTKRPDPTVTRPLSTTTTIDISGNEKYVFAAPTVVTSGVNKPLPAGLALQLRQYAKQYLHEGMWLPLTKQQRPTKLEGLFTTAALKRIKPGQPDASVLFDAVDGPTASKLDAVVATTVLTDPAGAPVSVALSLNATASGTGTIQRTGELLLLRIGATWKIAGYDITVTRSPGNGSAPTSSTAKATP